MSIDDVIQGWQKYSAVLYIEDSELFERMASDLNVEELERLGPGMDPFELIAMTLVFQQQKMIAWLLDAIEEREGKLGRLRKIDRSSGTTAKFRLMRGLSLSL